MNKEITVQLAVTPNLSLGSVERSKSVWTPQIGCLFGEERQSSAIPGNDSDWGGKCVE